MGLRLTHESHGQQSGDDRDRSVDRQAPTPGQELREHAAEEQADGRATAGDGAEDAERLGTFFGIVEGHGDQGQGCRGE